MKASEDFAIVLRLGDDVASARLALQELWAISHREACARRAIYLTIIHNSWLHFLDASSSNGGAAATAGVPCWLAALPVGGGFTQRERSSLTTCLSEELSALDIDPIVRAFCRGLASRSALAARYLMAMEPGSLLAART